MTDESARSAPGPAEDEAASESASKSKRKKTKLMIVVGSVAAVIVVAAAGFWIWHEQPAFCGTMCHDTMGSYLEGYEGDKLLAASHAGADVVCLDCHEPTLQQQIGELQKQLAGDYRLPLEKMAVDDEFCMRSGCHSREEIIAATADYTNDQGATANPHSMTFAAQDNQKTNPHGAGGESIPCSTCHTMHRKSVEMDYCYGCHHVKTFESCYNCH